MKKIQVVVLAFDGISPFHLSVPCVVFADAFAGKNSPFELKVCALKKGRLCASSGFDLLINHSLEVIAQADLVIIPSWHDLDKAPPQALINSLLEAYQQGATLVGLCLGAYLLAATGLLSGQKATTHWAYAENFAAQFPNIQVDAEPLYIANERLITSAGTAAAIDCCLHIVREKLGSIEANQVARRLVTAPYRHGGQKQYIALPLPERPSNKRIAQMMDWVLSDLKPTHNIDTIAQHCLMSRRSFTRQFKALMGTSFGQWLLNERLKYSQQLLENSSQPIAIISELAGFGSEVSFRRHFKQTFAVSPNSWRKTFSAD